MQAKLTVIVTYEISQSTDFEKLQEELQKIVNKLTVSSIENMRPINLSGNIEILEG